MRRKTGGQNEGMNKIRLRGPPLVHCHCRSRYCCHQAFRQVREKRMTTRVTMTTLPVSRKDVHSTRKQPEILALNQQVDRLVGLFMPSRRQRSYVFQFSDDVVV